MSATSYDAPPSPAPTQTHLPLGSNPAPRNGRDKNTIQKLIVALAIVTLIAILAPLVLFFTLSDDDTVAQTTVNAGADDVTVTAPSVDDPTEPDVAVAPAPTAAAPAAPAAAASSGNTSSAPAAAPAAAPVVTQLAGEAPAVYKVTGISTGSSLNVRQAAGTTNPLIGTLASNATDIAGTGRRVSVDGSEWREIKFNNGTGWVFAGYLAAAPAPAAASTPVPTATPEPVVVKPLAADSPAIYSVTGVSTGASLNVRAEPGVTQRLLGTLPGDTSAVPATGRRSLVGDVEWREIGFRNGTGWVNASYLELVPEAPKTIALPDIASSTVGIVPLTSPTDRLVLRTEPGYDKDLVGTVGASTVNITATGRQAQIGSEVWAQITASGTTGWVPRQLTIPVVKSAQDVLASSGVAAVRIDKVVVAENGDVSVTVGSQTLKVVANTTVSTAAGSISSVADWAHVAKTSTSPIAGEVTVVGNQITRIWLAS